MSIEYITLTIYLGVLLTLGVLFSRFNKNLSDFVRGGAQGTWWMVGTSILMAGISAYTFTGNASAAYEAGPSLLVVYLANCAGFAAGGLFLGKWFRQTRAYTSADVVRTRFGVPVEQFSACSGLLLGPVNAAIQLYALSLFTSTALGLDLVPILITIGVIVVFYSTTGGRWAVMATDFVQSLILFSITILVLVMTFREIGGIGAFFSHFNDPKIAEDYRLINEPGHFSGDRFTLKWAIIVFFMQLYSQISLSDAGRYLSTKDGHEASRSAWWACILMAIGSAIWFLPAMATRFMYENELMTSGLDKPAEHAYAFIAMKLLPNGMLGMLIAAMFAATMSSMDSGLNGQVGTLVRNIIPRLRGALGHHNPLPAKTEIRICHISTLVLGAIIITYALLFAVQDKITLFDAYLTIGSIIGVPMGFPMLAGLWMKKLPKWSYFPIFGACVIPSIWSFIDEAWYDSAWTYQDRTLWILVFGVVATLICRLLAPLSSKRQQEEIAEFFKRMHTPIDYDKEVGRSAIDYQQYFVLGRAILFIGCLLMFILIVPNSLYNRLCIVGVSLFVLAVGGILCWCGTRTRRLTNEHLAQKQNDESGPDAEQGTTDA